MKRLFSSIILCSIMIMWIPARIFAVKFKDQNLEIGGEVLVHYIIGDFDWNDVSLHWNPSDGSKYIKGDIETRYGGDKIVCENVYLWAKYQFSELISANVKLDFAQGDLANNKELEEAYIHFDKIMRDIPIFLRIGKFEQPFGMDYDVGAFDPFPHTYEIDKVWGIMIGYEIKDIGKIEASVIDLDDIDDIGNNGNGVADESNATLSDGFSARITLDRLMPNIFIEASYATRADTPAWRTNTPDPCRDNDRWSIGLQFELDEIVRGLTIFGEILENERFDNTKTVAESFISNEKVWQAGFDWKFSWGWRLVYSYNDYDDDDSADTNFKNAHLIQLHKEITKNITLMIEYMDANAESNVNVMDDQGAVIVALKAKF
ncbi:MAG: hypothetical protein AB1765_01775 [Candidatus Hydrogenedentota bacterium]